MFCQLLTTTPTRKPQGNGANVNSHIRLRESAFDEISSRKYTREWLSGCLDATGGKQICPYKTNQQKPEHVELGWMASTAGTPRLFSLVRSMRPAVTGQFAPVSLTEFSLAIAGVLAA